ncbi:serine/threonine protein kinase [Spirosoma utsteinense]|uniref:Serine/threonine-protein kinase n=1 Tax=Spirosoma utsteinense TaxID=2585773 RepID=A0ABR6WD84_9BACT|nr:serine/threonine-protein kinase [Spirosoma utsteinense]MBC3788750.1 serine/threonine-protein kinase [Spirosoma utsteinense]MBC3794520.1 serine/threonine-protein kinase [Spirosoma utsteinense]
MATIRFNTQFPGYEILSELGRSNARILKARHLATGDLVAIKHFALNTDAETLRRFQRESAIMTSIAHPNIVKVREVQLEAELPFIVMELIEGGNLHHLIRQQHQLDVPTTIRIGLQMASAFKAIHPQGIVHRDIKPENILYRPLPSGELHFLLTDFGVARLQEQSTTMTGQSLMTYEYASPEQFNDPKGVGVATDYYSLGVVLYECLNGHVPFALDDHSGIVTFMNKVLSEAPPALLVTTSDQPMHPFVDLLNALLQKKAADRLSDADELTWRLKQAELNYLQATRISQPPIARHTTAATIAPTPTPPEPTKPRTPASNEPPTILAPIEDPAKRKKKAGIGLKLIVLVLIVSLAGVGYYLTFLKPGGSVVNNPFTGNPIEANDSSATGDTESAQPEDTQLQQEAEERLRREQLKKDALLAAKELSVEPFGYRVGLFGGIKNIQVKLDNPSPFTFALVAVRVDYHKEKGPLYKSEKVWFGNVGPNASLTRKAPDSDRGTRITAKVVGYEFSKELDSLLTSTPTDSLN